MSVNNISVIQINNQINSFLLNCVRNGLAHSFDTEKLKWVKPYPEVTGYLLSYFSKEVNNYNPEKSLALLKVMGKMSKRLLRLQHSCGGFRSFYGDSLYVFDTAQICHGLLDYYQNTGDENLLKACFRGTDFIINMQTNMGAFYPIFNEKKNEKQVIGTNWSNSFSPINSKCIEFLSEMQRFTDDYKLIDAINRCAKFALKTPQILYTHPGAYSLEGLIKAGYNKEVKERIEKNFLPQINTDGFIPYHPTLNYSYVSGSAQIAILCNKVGFYEYAISIFNWLRRVQLNHNSGGLFQYANRDCSINVENHSEINSWGTKYFGELINNIFYDEKDNI